MRSPILIVALTLLISQTTFASATGLWTTFQGNPQHTGYLPMQVNPQKFHVLWRKQLAETTDTGWYVTQDAAVTEKMIYVTLQDFASSYAELTALETSTGKIAWQIPFDYSLGISAPAYTDDKLFITSWQQGSGEKLRAYKAQTGKLLFTTPISSLSLSLYGTPVATDTIVYAPTNSATHAINTTTGRPTWVSTIGESFSPALNGDHLYSMSWQKLIASDATNGAQIYSITNNSHYPSQTNSLVINATKQLIYFSGNGENRDLFAYDLTTQQLKWESVGNYYDIQPVLANSTLFAWDYSRGLTALDAETGALQWQTNAGIQETIYPIFVATDTVVFLAGEKNTYAISRDTHQIVWQIPITGRLVLGNQQLFIIGTDHQVTAVALN